MAIVTGTQTRYDIVGDREDLADSIYDISPEKTPFFSSIGRGKAKSTFHEWQTDSLADATDDNAHLEGDETSFATPAPTVRVGNYTQIVKKSLIVSGTMSAIDLAGRKDEQAYQLMKRSKEIKRDIEKILLANAGAEAGSTTVARKLASLGAWVKTNVNFGAGGANPTYTSGAPAAGRTDGTQRAFTLDIAKDAMQQAWTEGGEPSTLMVGPHNKTVVSGFDGIATRTVNLNNGSPSPMIVVASVDILVTDFGNLRVVPNRFQRDRDGWFLDFSLCSVPYLRSFRTEKLAKTGDAEKHHLLAELTLRVNQEAGLALAADLATS